VKVFDSRRNKAGPLRAWLVTYNLGRAEDVWVTDAAMPEDYVAHQSELRYADVVDVEEVKVVGYEDTALYIPTEDTCR
jgi:hypothetical protein